MKSIFRRLSAFDYNIWHHYHWSELPPSSSSPPPPTAATKLRQRERLLKKKRKICLFLGRYTTIPRHENTKTNTFTYILQTAAALVALWKRKWWKWFVLQKYTEKWSCLWLSCQLLVPIFFWCILALPFFNHSYLNIYLYKQPIKALEKLEKSGLTWFQILNIVVVQSCLTFLPSHRVTNKFSYT